MCQKRRLAVCSGLATNSSRSFNLKPDARSGHFKLPQNKLRGRNHERRNDSHSWNARWPMPRVLQSCQVPRVASDGGGAMRSLRRPFWFRRQNNRRTSAASKMRADHCRAKWCTGNASDQCSRSGPSVRGSSRRQALTPSRLYSF